jgi:hypothetical protein
MRTFIVVTALLLLAGCQQSPQPQAKAPPAAAQTPSAPPHGPPAAAPNQGAQPPPPPRTFSKDQEEFKTGAMDKTREEVHAKYGQPDELGEWGAAVGWDGPVSIYHGPFTSADGMEKKNARVYFRQGKAASVEFTNQ